MQSDEALRQALHQWKVDASLPPRFREEVWRRIERREAQAPAWTALFSRLNTALARPSLAVSYVTVLLLAGLLAGYWQVRVTKARLDEALSSRYVQMVDPFQSPHR
jgi:anti-sigma factor RsiW